MASERPGLDEVAQSVAALGTVRIAKRLFLSDWCDGSAREVLRPEEIATLEGIQAETEEEIEATNRLIARWRREQPDVAALHDEALRVRHVVTHEFLRFLIAAKEQTGAIYERAAAVAPNADLRRELLMLGGIDFTHAHMLREILLRREGGPAAP